MAARDSQPTRSADQIEANLVATRQRLTASLETLIDQVHPSRVKQRKIAQVKAFLAAKRESATALMFNARGDLRKDRLAALGGALAGAVAFVWIIRAIARRGRNG